MQIAMFMLSRCVSLVMDLGHSQRTRGKGLHTQHLLRIKLHKPARNMINIVTYYRFVVRVFNALQTKGKIVCIFAFWLL